MILVSYNDTNNESEKVSLKELNKDIKLQLL